MRKKIAMHNGMRYGSKTMSGMASGSVADMPRPPSDAKQIAIRVPAAWLREADEIAKLLSRPGIDASRTDAFRAAIAKGFEVIRAEHTATPTRKSTARR